MRDLSPQTLIAVFEEMFGRGVFGGMVAAATAITPASLCAFPRDRAARWRKLPRARLSTPVGAVAAVPLVLGGTRPSLSDLRGPIDVVILLGIAGAGAVGAAILVSTPGPPIGCRRTKGASSR